MQRHATSSLRLLLPALALLPACSTGPVSPLHGQWGVKAHGVAWSSQDVDIERQSGLAVGQLKGVSSDVTGIGALVEYFLDAANVSVTGGIQIREYETFVPAVPGRRDVDGTELQGGVRYYLDDNSDLQYFFTLIFTYGLGLELAPGVESDSYWRYGLGGGLSWFLGGGLVAEGLLLYEGNLTPAETVLGPGLSQEDEFTGWTGILGIGFFF